MFESDCDVPNSEIIDSRTGIHSTLKPVIPPIGFFRFVFFIRPNFEYLAGVLDYSILSKGSIDVFARAAIAPAHQRDLFLYHSEHHFTVLGIAGIGADIGFNRFSITGYLSNKGIPSLLFSYGWYFGGKAKAKPNLNQDK